MWHANQHHCIDCIEDNCHLIFVCLYLLLLLNQSRIKAVQMHRTVRWAAGNEPTLWTTAEALHGAQMGLPYEQRLCSSAFALPKSSVEAPDSYGAVLCCTEDFVAAALHGQVGQRVPFVYVLAGGPFLEQLPARCVPHHHSLVVCTRRQDLCLHLFTCLRTRKNIEVSDKKQKEWGRKEKGETLLSYLYYLPIHSSDSCGVTRKGSLLLSYVYLILVTHWPFYHFGKQQTFHVPNDCLLVFWGCSYVLIIRRPSYWPYFSIFAC